MNLNIENTNYNKIRYVLEWIFKIGFLAYALLSFNSLCYGRVIISLVLWPTLLVGGFVLVMRVMKYKNYIKMPGLLFLALFLVSHIISAVANIRYGYKEGIIKFIFLTFYFLILFTKEQSVSLEDMKKEVKILGAFLEIYMFLCVALSFGFMICKYTQVRTIQDGWDIGIGFLWGRLWGVFTEPNYAAICACVTIVLAVYFIQSAKKKAIKAFLVINSILQLLYIAFTDSRTGRVGLGITVFIWVFNKLNYNRLHKAEKRKSELCIIICVSIFAFVVGASVPKWITNTYNMWQASHQEVAAEVNRGYDLTEDPSNRRFDIWKSGIEVFSTTPIVGTSYTNILPYTLEHCEGTYLINNSAEKRFSSIHNEFLNVLVGQGIIGFIILVGFVIYSIRYYVKFYFRMTEEEQHFGNMLIASIAGISAGAMFLTGMFYSNSPSAILFWIFLGDFLVIARRIKEREE